MKKLISKYGDFILAVVGVAAVLPLFQWFLTAGPLYDFIVKFAG